MGRLLIRQLGSVYFALRPAALRRDQKVAGSITIAHVRRLTSDWLLGAASARTPFSAREISYKDDSLKVAFPDLARARRYILFIIFLIMFTILP